MLVHQIQKVKGNEFLVLPFHKVNLVEVSKMISVTKLKHMREESGAGNVFHGHALIKEQMSPATTRQPQNVLKIYVAKLHNLDPTAPRNCSAEVQKA